MSTPRQPYGPDDREHAAWDPYHRDPDDESGGAWGGPPAGDRGTAGTGYGRDPRAAYGGEYGAPSATGYGDERYRDERYRERGSQHSHERGHERYEPSWGQGPPVAPRRSAHGRRRPPWVVLAAAGVVVVAVLVLGFVTPGWFVTRVFDASAVQTGVAKILTDDYGMDGVADVHCPGGVPVATGTTFTCDAAVDGDPVKVPVRVTDAKGGYMVGRPA